MKEEVQMEKKEGNKHKLGLKAGLIQFLGLNPSFVSYTTNS